jgi:predicted MFS family arabinose efflux permease
MKETDVPLIYLVGGLTSVVVMRVVGKLSDKFGSFIVFSTLSVLAGIPILSITNLSTLSLVIILLLAAALFTFGGSRGVPANTLISSTAPPHLRGGFLSLNSAMQQLGAGVASFIGGMLIADGPNNTVLHYSRVGWFAVAASLIAIPVALYIRPKKV